MQISSDSAGFNVSTNTV